MIIPAARYKRIYIDIFGLGGANGALRCTLPEPQKAAHQISPICKGGTSSCLCSCLGDNSNDDDNDDASDAEHCPAFASASALGLVAADAPKQILLFVSCKFYFSI